MLTSCSFKKDIMVSYLYDGVETPFSVEPKKFDSDFQHYKVDMSYIPKNEFDSIYNGFKKTNAAIDAACFFCTYKKSPCIYMQRDDNSPWYHPVSRSQII